MTTNKKPTRRELNLINEALSIDAESPRAPMSYLSYASDELLEALASSRWNRNGDGAFAWDRTEQQMREDLGLPVLVRLERLRRDFAVISEARTGEAGVSLNEALCLLLDSFHSSGLGEQHAADVNAAEEALTEELHQRMRDVRAAMARHEKAPDFTESLLHLFTDRRFATSYEIAILSRKPHEEVMADILAMKPNLNDGAFCEENKCVHADGEFGHWFVLDSATALTLLSGFNYFPEFSSAMWGCIFDRHASASALANSKQSPAAAEAAEEF